MSTSIFVGEQRVVLRSVSWQTYEALVTESEHAGGRMIYDRGVLEIMSPSMLHENAGSLLGRMIEMFSLLQDIEIRTAASTTFKRGDLERGFEADESYYIQHAAQVRGRADIDLAIDPPPDLVIEIDITRTSIDKLGLFASMGIPEVWRYNGETLWAGQRSGEDYLQTTESRVLPGFPLQLAQAILRQQLDAGETSLIRKFVNEVEAADATGTAD